MFVLCVCVCVCVCVCGSLVYVYIYIYIFAYGGWGKGPTFVHPSPNILFLLMLKPFQKVFINDFSSLFMEIIGIYPTCFTFILFAPLVGSCCHTRDIVFYIFCISIVFIYFLQISIFFRIFYIMYIIHI